MLASIKPPIEKGHSKSSFFYSMPLCALTSMQMERERIIF